MNSLPFRTVELIESIPNVSEGRRPEVVTRLADAIRQVPGARVLHSTSDINHNRSVLSLAGNAVALKAAILALFEVAIASIDLRSHVGGHPRLGAVDVVPFVPLQHATMADCIALARETGREIADRFGVPVYLYEYAASTPGRKALEHIRKGQFEGLTAKMALPDWAPDYGPARPHPSAGATVIGARGPLIAYNINLASPRLDLARAIAASIRASSGGLPFVKAMGVSLSDRHLVQVSMNLTNYEVTPLSVVFDAVRREAERLEVEVLESEIVGLVPRAALPEDARTTLKLTRFSDDQVLETRLRDSADV